MADERDFELLDDYLTNRLSEQDRSAFEQRLQSDPDLQQEYALQKRVIQGIKDARVAQLKSMLNQVPVPSAAGNAIASKVLFGTVVAIVIAAAALWFYRHEPSAPKQPQRQSEQKSTTPDQEPANTGKLPEKESLPSITQDAHVQESDRNQTSAGTEHSKPSLAKRPDPVSGPAGNTTDRDEKAADAVASVVIIDTNAGYTYHYGFNNGNLTLYGPFEEGSYEIVTVETGAKSVVSLYHQEKYHVLDETAGEIRSLKPVTDSDLLGKLEKQRTSN